MSDPVILKTAGLVQSIESEEYPHGGFHVVLSAATLDRDGEVVDTRAFEPLPAHITFDIDHGMSVRSVVGSGVPFYAVDGTLQVKGGFSSIPLAQEVRTLVKEGHIRTTSVAAMSTKRETKDGVPHIVSGELLNGSFVAIPSNRESVVLSAKAFSAAEETAPAGVVHKSIVGSIEALRDRVADALEDTYPGKYPNVHGVIPAGEVNAGGTVVFDVWGDEGRESYQTSYDDDGAVVTLTGDPSPVDVLEIVLPDADADREAGEDDLKAHTDSEHDEKAAETATDAAKAAPLTVEAADEVDTARARLKAHENAASLAFGR